MYFVEPEIVSQVPTRQKKIEEPETSSILLDIEAVARRCSVKKVFLKISREFTAKHLCQSLFFNKVAALKSATLLKKRQWHRCFPLNFVKFPRTPFLTENLRWLLLRRRVDD